jgi:hypothetical protein
MPKLKLSCDYCNIAFEVWPSKRKKGGEAYCTRECMGKAKRGANHPNYTKRIKCTCAYCGKSIEKTRYETKNYRATYCNATCHNKAQTGIEIAPRLELKCKQCGNIFRVKKSKLSNHSMFCTERCRYDSQKKPKVERTCQQCKSVFLVHASDIKYHVNKFCSKKCKDEHQQGEAHWRWKNATSENDRIRHSKEYKAWRTAVFIRDDRKCVICGSKKDIEADHIKPRYLFPELTLELSNGRTLCHECHEKTPSYMNGYMTRADFA